MKQYLKWYDKLEWTVIPIPWGKKEATFDFTRPELLSQKYMELVETTSNTNIALLGGEVSRHTFAIDFDLSGLREELFPDLDYLVENTLVSQTPSGGYHVFFATIKGVMPNITLYYYDEKTGKNREALSIRSTKTLTTLPPSKHPNGGIYKFLSDISQIVKNGIGGFISVQDFHERFLARLKKINNQELALQYERRIRRVAKSTNSSYLPSSSNERGYIYRKTRPLDHQNLEHVLEPHWGSKIRLCAKNLIIKMQRTQHHFPHLINVFLAVEIYHDGFRRSVIHQIFNLAKAYDLQKRCIEYSYKETDKYYNSILFDKKDEELGSCLRRYSCAKLQTDLFICLGSVCPSFKKTEFGKQNPRYVPYGIAKHYDNDMELPVKKPTFTKNISQKIMLTQ